MTGTSSEAEPTSFPSALDCQRLSGSEIVPWSHLEERWQEKLQGAMAAGIPPRALLFPHSQDDLAETVRYAAENRWTLLPCGNGSKLHWGGLAGTCQLAVSSQRLNRIVDLATNDLTVTVEAGMKLADLQATLNPHHQFLPLDPAYPESATIGGIVATADTGSWRQGYGGVRDLVLGLAFVRSDGQIAKAGGRVVKNVAGYDLMKLLAGSYGTLGIISQVTFRLYPLPEASATLTLTGDSRAIAAASQTLLRSGLAPTAADLLSPSLVRGLDVGEGMGLALRFQSIPESVAEQSRQVETLGQALGLGVSAYQEDAEVDLWQRLSTLLTVPASSSAVTGKIGLMPNAAASFLQQLDELTGHQGLGALHRGSGLGKIQLAGEGILSQLERLRSLCQNSQGFLTVLEAPRSLKQQFEPWGCRGNGLEMMEKIQQKFDPHSIFSPGRFLGGI